MMSSTVRRAVLAGAVLCGSALFGSALFGSALAPVALAEPVELPPNCTAADRAAVLTGVAAATSAYLFTHPDVNAFFTGLQSMPSDQVRTELVAYMDAHPQTHDELRGIRAPMVDLRNRCGAAVAPEQP